MARTIWSCSALWLDLGSCVIRAKQMGKAGHSMRRCLGAFGLCLISMGLSGCVGAGKVSGHPHEWDDNDQARFGLCPIEYDKTIVSCSKSRIQEVTPDKLHKLWGAPKTVRIENGNRTVVYNQKLAWRGVVVFVVAPVPLLVPLGHDEATFIFKNGKLSHVRYLDNELDAAICGLHSEGPNGFGCISHWH